MLIRIAPNMFVDEAYGCVTIKRVRDEVFQTSKFRAKYPWRTTYRSQIKALPTSQFNTPNYDQMFSAVDMILSSGVINGATKRPFDLSLEDKCVVACALSNDYRICTGDDNLIAFAAQEFDAFQGSVPALGLINQWLEQSLLSWSPQNQALLLEWKTDGEKRQPKNEVSRFNVITGYSYPGP